MPLYMKHPFKAADVLPTHTFFQMNYFTYFIDCIFNTHEFTYTCGAVNVPIELKYGCASKLIARRMVHVYNNAIMNVCVHVFAFKWLSDGQRTVAEANYKASVSYSLNQRRNLQQ